jgi:hypothetical protein
MNLVNINWYYRCWNTANTKLQEQYADQYAIQKTAIATDIFNKLMIENQ